MPIGNITKLATLGAVFDFVNKGHRDLAEAHKDLEKVHGSVDDVVRSTKVLGLTGPQLAAFGAGLTAVGVGGLVLFNQIGRSATDLQARVAQVTTLLDDQGRAALSQQAQMGGLIALSSSYGVAAEELGTGLFQVKSAGVEAAQAMGVLEVATRAANAGNADVSTTVTGITQVMNAYGNELLGVTNQTQAANKVADLFFQTNKEGLTTMGELARSMGTVAPSAAGLKIPLEEVSAAIATITSQGINTRRATTFLNQALSNIRKPSSEASKAAAKLGIEFNATALQGMGLAGFLDELVTKSGGSQEAMAQLFGSVEAFNAIAVLAGGQGSARFARALGEMENAAGSTDRALEDVAATADFQARRRQSSIEGVTKAISGTLLPIFTSFDRVVANVASSVSEWVAENPELVRGLGAVSAALSATAVVGGVALIAIGGLAAATAAWAAFSGPLLLAAGALAPLGIGIGVTSVAVAGLTMNFDTLREGFRRTFEGTGGPEHAADLLRAMREAADPLAESLTMLGQALGIIGEDADAASMGLGGLFGVFTSEAIQGITDLVTWTGALAETFNEIADAIARVPILGDILGAAFDAGQLVTPHGQLELLGRASDFLPAPAAAAGGGGGGPTNIDVSGGTTNLKVDLDGREVGRAQARTDLQASERTGPVSAADVGAVVDR